MADIYCTRCGEPWDASHVRNEAFDLAPTWDGRDEMPEHIAVLWDAAAEERTEEALDRLGLAYYETGLGQGCTACWSDPSRVLDGDERMAAVEAALFDGVWDGDPMELLEGLL